LRAAEGRGAGIVRGFISDENPIVREQDKRGRMFDDAGSHRIVGGGSVVPPHAFGVHSIFENHPVVRVEGWIQLCRGTLEDGSARVIEGEAVVNMSCISIEGSAADIRWEHIEPRAVALTPCKKI